MRSIVSSLKNIHAPDLPYYRSVEKAFGDDTVGLEKAVQEFVKNILDDNHYCTKKESEDIAQLIADELYTKFSGEITTIHKEVDEQRKREDRIWDILHEKPAPRFAKLRKWGSWLLFWRR